MAAPTNQQNGLSEYIEFFETNPDAYHKHRKELTTEITKIKEQMRALQEEYERKAFDYECLELIEYAMSGPASAKVLETLDPAMQDWRKSLVPPEGWAEESDVPYTETDDYGDLSSLEEAVDCLLDWISDLHESEKMGETTVAILSTAVHLNRCGQIITTAMDPHPLSGDWDEMRDSLAGKWENLMPDIKRDMLGVAGLSVWRDLFNNYLRNPFDSLSTVMCEEQ